MSLVPVAATISSVTATSFLVTVNPDGNPAPPATYYTFKVVFGSNIKYVNSLGNLQDTKEYLPVLSITINGLTSNTLHSITLTAADDAIGTGESIEGPVSTATTLAALPIAEVFSNTFATTVMANWDANGNPDGTEYELEISTDGSFVFDVVNTGWITTVGYVFTNLLPDTPYYVRVRARNSVLATTAFVSLGSVTTLVAPDTVKAIRVYNLLAERGYLITWQPNQETDIVNYKVYRSGSPTDNASFELLGTVVKPITSYLDKQPYTFGIVFYYKVTAIDAGENESSLILTTPAHENTFHSFEEQPFPVMVTSQNFVTDETPGGIVDGINTLFTTAFPYQSGTVEAYLDGVKMYKPTEFVEGPQSQQITFLDPPDVGGQLRVSYVRF